jgi:CelD/BcsL family acetyltransferase involved in cellulose biosynthesis
MQLSPLKRGDWNVSMTHPSASDEQIAYEIVADTSGLQALRDDWQRLWQASAGGFYVMSFPVLLRTWTEVLEPRGDRLHIIVGRQAERVVLIWPQFIRGKRYYGIWREARWFSRDPIDYGDVLVEASPRREAWVEGALNHLVATAKVDFHLFESVREDANAFCALERACTWKVADAPAPYMDLRPWNDLEGFESKLKSKFRRELRRHARRLEEIGAATFELDPEPERLEELIRWMSERKWEWIGERGVVKAHGLAEEHNASLIAIIRDGAKTGNTLVGQMFVNGELVAASVSFLAGKRVYYDYGAFDLRWEKYSPGSLLLREKIRWAMHNGYEIFDLAPGTDRDKVNWKDSEIAITDYLIARTLLGRLFVVLRGSNMVRNWIIWMRARFKKRGPADQHD